MKKVLLGIVCSMFLASCIPPLALKARFDRVGLVTGNEKNTATTPPEDIKVYYGNSPEGFSLKENELKVEPGFSHRILGPVSVGDDYGSCYELDKYKPNISKSLENLVRDKASKVGANAVIYYSTDVTQDDTAGDFRRLCLKRRDRMNNLEYSYARGWAVVIVDNSSNSPASPESTTK